MSILSNVTYMLTEKPSNIFYMLQSKDGTDYSSGEYSIYMYTVRGPENIDKIMKTWGLVGRKA